MIQYTLTKTDSELLQILELQKANSPKAISKAELQSQGFVSARHDLELLRRMNNHFPHILAKDSEQVIGYALVMLRSFDNIIPILTGLFQEIDAAVYKERSVKDSRYFVMGQVCIAKGYRGQGLFEGLFQKMREEMAPHFEYIITSVSTRNQRSLRAHYKVGFRQIHEYTSFGEDWIIILWDWR